MTRPPCVWLLAALPIVACSQPSGERAKSVDAASASACPAKDFAGFVEAFIADLDVQRRFTVVPLRSRFLQNGPIDPVRVEQTLSASDLRFPIILSRQEQAARGLTLEIHDETTINPWIRLEKPDTDYLITYHFSKSDCWRLTFEDSSSL